MENQTKKRSIFGSIKESFMVIESMDAESNNKNRDILKNNQQLAKTIGTIGIDNPDYEIEEMPLMNIEMSLQEYIFAMEDTLKLVARNNQKRLAATTENSFRLLQGLEEISEGQAKEIGQPAGR